MHARIMTWNLWWQFGPWRERQQAILSTISAEQPDLVCLQEVFEAAGGLDQAQWLADELGYYMVRTQGRWDADVSFGNAILSRWPVARWNEHRLPGADGSPGHRRLLTAQVDSPFGLVWTACTHLDHEFDQSATRIAQCEAVCALIDTLRTNPKDEIPVLLAGDFNSVPDSDEIRMMTGRREPAVEGLVFTDAWEIAGDGHGHTWRRDNPYIADSAWPNRRLDYIFVSWPRPRPLGNPLRVWLAGVQPVHGVQASDHAAVLADIQLVEGAEA